MPIIKSAIKRVRQQAKRQERNRAQKTEFRSLVKSFNAAVASKKSADISSTLQKLQSQVDTLVKKNILHKNTAARKMKAFSAQAKAAGAKVTAGTSKPAAKKTPAKTATKKPSAKKATPKKTASKKS